MSLQRMSTSGQMKSSHAATRLKMNHGILRYTLCYMISREFKLMPATSGLTQDLRILMLGYGTIEELYY